MFLLADVFILSAVFNDSHICMHFFTMLSRIVVLGMGQGYLYIVIAQFAMSDVVEEVTNYQLRIQ